MNRPGCDHQTRDMRNGLGQRLIAAPVDCGSIDDVSLRRHVADVEGLLGCRHLTRSRKFGVGSSSIATCASAPGRT